MIQKMFTAQELADLTQKSLLNFDPNSLAYLAVTGKIELPVRDALGALLTKEFPQMTAAREYQRRDLVLLENGIPQLVVEGKLWISFEASVPTKLHHPNPKDGLVAAAQSDIEKMRNFRQDSECAIFISTVLFAADIRRLDKRHLPAVKYPNWHRRGLAGSDNLEVTHGMGVQAFRDAVSSFGLCAESRLFEGQVFGMPVLADVVVCKVDH
jgi:hypothetical protein